MVAKNMSALFFALILIFSNQGNSEAFPMRDYDGVPSGVIHPISGVAPVSVHRRRPDKAEDRVLREIRARVDKIHLSDLDSSIRNDILQDELAPPECHDKYGIRDGFLKHTLRGTRDILGAVLRDIKGLGGELKNIPLVPHVINGLAEATTYVLCGAENALSDVISGADDVPNILTKVLVDLFELKGTPLADIPAGVINITEVIAKLAVKAVHDVVVNVEEGVDDLVIEVKSGVKEVAHDVVEVVSGVETDVVHVVNAVDDAVQMIGDGVVHGVDNIVDGVDGAVHTIGGGVAKGVHNIVHGVAGGLRGVVHLL